eukprot:12087744-Alexandrium_andersonii.AAC.1
MQTWPAGGPPSSSRTGMYGRPGTSGARRKGWSSLPHCRPKGGRRMFSRSPAPRPRPVFRRLVVPQGAPG